jgi:lysophospholipase L1-like esterase
MHRIRALLLTLVVLHCGIAQAQATKPTIFVCGDSTSKYSSSETMTNLRMLNGRQMAGWGTPIAQFFDPEKVTINNVGQAGTSSMSYYTGNWPRVLPQIKAGDYVLIVFGINDGTTPNGIGDEIIERPLRGGRGPATPSGAAGATQPAQQMESVHTYGWYMARMATEAREKGAHVYFLTVTTRNMWKNPKVKFNDAKPVDANNQPLATMPEGYDPREDRIERGTGDGRYTQWTKEVAAKLNIPVFDLTNACADLYEEMGREEVDKLYSDHNHTYLEGATTVARVIVGGLKAFKNSPFVPMLSDPGKEIPAADAKHVSDNLR